MGEFAQGRNLDHRWNGIGVCERVDEEFGLVLDGDVAIRKVAAEWDMRVVLCMVVDAEYGVVEDVVGVGDSVGRMSWHEVVVAGVRIEDD